MITTEVGRTPSIVGELVSSSIKVGVSAESVAEAVLAACVASEVGGGSPGAGSLVSERVKVGIAVEAVAASVSRRKIKAS